MLSGRGLCDALIARQLIVLSKCLHYDFPSKLNVLSDSDINMAGAQTCEGDATPASLNMCLEIMQDMVDVFEASFTVFFLSFSFLFSLFLSFLSFVEFTNDNIKKIK